MNLWHISEDAFDPTPKRMHSQETVYSIGNGYFCTRGALEEGYPHETTATLLFGVFDTIPIAKEELANAPDWTSIQLFVNGERFRLNQGTTLEYQRTLDLYNAELSRIVRWQSPSGIRLRIQTQRFASLADEHTAAIRYSVTIEETNRAEKVDIELRAALNTAQGNYDMMHWETIDQSHQGEVLWLLSQTKHTGIQLAQTMSFTTQHEHRLATIDSDIAPSIRLYGSLRAGETLTAEKIVVMYTSRDTKQPVQAALEHHLEITTTTHIQEPDIRQALAVETASVSSATNVSHTYDRLFAPHRNAWAQFWQQSDVIIEGDDKAQLGIRYNIYQLRINASSHDSHYSIAAKGMTGFGYRGHIFHDTEIFMLPFFTYVLPDFARNLLLYRYHLLPAARKKAASNGYEGAQFPWESTMDGEEATPGSIIHPETGEVIPVLNGFIELHITASIAYSYWQYWFVTGDDDFMRDYGVEMLLSTGMFWASRAEKNEERGDYEITNVIGPDEWHEHVNNNAYTNYMARWNIQQALESLSWLKEHSPAKAEALLQQIGLTQKHLEHWRDVVQHLRMPQDPQTGLFEQFDDFFKLEHLDQSQFKGRKDSYQGILGIHAVQKYQIVKQADVLMLLTVLDHEFDLKTKRVNWDYYYPITDHDYGSSLTPALHVILACELGLIGDSYRQFEKGNLVDLENLRGNTPEGVHTACAGAVWQAAIFGFAGLRVSNDGYTTNPTWPDSWTRLAFTIKHHGKTHHIDLRRS